MNNEQWNKWRDAVEKRFQTKLRPAMDELYKLVETGVYNPGTVQDERIVDTTMKVISIIDSCGMGSVHDIYLKDLADRLAAKIKEEEDED